MNFLNPKPLSQKERWQRALVFGIPFSILVGILTALLNRALGNIQFGIVYIGVGWVIAWFIQTVSHGAQKKFRYLALACYVLALLVAEVVFIAILYDINIFNYLMIYLRALLSVDINSLLGILIRILGGVVAYQNI